MRVTIRVHNFSMINCEPHISKFVNILIGNKFKYITQSDTAYNRLFYMLDEDNITSTSVSEAVEKIPTDEKDYHKCCLICFTLRSYSIQRTVNPIANSRSSFLPTRIHPVQLKKSLKTFYIKFTQKKVQQLVYDQFYLLWK